MTDAGRAGVTESTWLACRGFDFALRAGPVVLVGLTIAVLAAAQGGYFPVAWGWAALAMFWAAGYVLATSATVALPRAELVYLGALACFVGWIALSLLWSSNLPSTVDEVERALVYLSAATAFLLLARRGQVRMILAAILAAVTVICAYALATRLFPTELSADALGAYRLFTPIGYWNGLGLFATLGALLALGFVATARSPTGCAAAAASLPLLVTTLYFTFSRGAWLAGGVGFCIALAISPRRLRLLAALAASLPAPLLGVVVASRQHALSRGGAGRTEIEHQGHRLAVAVLVFCLLGAACGALFHDLERRVKIGRAARRWIGVALVALAIAGIAGATFAAGGPEHVARQAYDRFTSNPARHTDLNGRLFDLSSNGRTALWHAAWGQFSVDGVLGSGAGTFEQYWNRHRTSNVTVRDAHNLYLETLAELGVAGLVLLVVLLAVPFVGVRARRRQSLVPVAVGAYAVTLVHAGYDWDWELPVLMLTGIFCGLAALAAARRTHTLVTLQRPARIGMLCAVGVCAAFSFVALIGNISASRAQSAIDGGHYAKAVSNAQRAADWAPWSGRPWFALGTAQARLGRTAEAVRSLRTAVRNDPTNYRYWLALAAVAHGKERIAALQQVFRLNPRYRAT